MSQLTIFDAIESERLKELGMSNAAHGYGATEWLAEARKVAEILAAKHGEVTADMVLRLCPRPESVSSAVTGSIFKGKQWKCIGTSLSNQVSRHRGIQRRWTLVDSV